MRNLKKVLALVLALAMALSVMASAFTAPEYTEEAKAEYEALTAAQQDAFYTLTALGIVEGFSDGSFRAEENLTRAQFAKMVYCAKTGDVAKENALFANATVIFTDAIDTWAIPYVAYAYSAGIVAGYPDGTFQATKSVTGLEAAKMLLTALGYDAEIEGLVGPTFYANTIKLATAAGLFNGVKGDIYAAVTRADAFVMFANALKANTVTYIGGVATPKTSTLSSFDTITLAEEGFNLIDTEAVLVATEKWALNGYENAREGYVTFAKGNFAFPVALGDQAAKFAELGHKYRVLVDLDTKVMYGYPVEVAEGAYYDVIKGDLADAADYTAEATTIFANGAVVDAAKADELIAKYADSTATFKAIDNENDKTVDTLFFNYYTIGTVKAIDGNDVTFVGVNLGKKTIANASEFAVGDYAAVWSDGDGTYAKKLAVKEANVTGYTQDGKYIIDGAKCTFGSYADASDENLVGDNTKALTDTVYKFVFDGSYIVNVELTANTRFAKYALVVDVERGTYLGYPMVTLFTEDNEYITTYAKTVDGIEKAIVNNGLVAYELDGDFAYITTVASKSTFEGNTVSNDYDFIFNRATQTWEGTALNSTVSFKDTHGVVFVTYGKGLIRAYYNGEFQPSYYNEFEAKIRDGEKDLVVYVQQNGVNYIKAAVITFDHPEYQLPGLPTTRANDNFVILAKDVTVEKTAEGYVYTYEVFQPWSTATKTMTSVPFAYQQAQPSKNTVWNFKTNADGKVTAINAVNFKDEALFEDTAYVLGTDGVEMYGYLVTAFNMDVYGNIIMTLSDVTTVYDDEVIVSDTYTINVSADADVYFFEAGSSLSAKDWMSYIEYDYNNNDVTAKKDNFVAYVDLNPTTQVANRVILVAGSHADALAKNEVTVTAKVTYNTVTKKMTYDFGNALDVVDQGDIFKALVAKYADAKVYPWDTAFCADGYVTFTFENINDVWTVTDVKGVEEATLYSNSIEGATAGIQFVSFDAKAGLSMKAVNDVLIDAEDIDAIYMYRTYNDRLDRLYDEDRAVAYGDLADVAALVENVTATKADNKCETYEGIWVIEAANDEIILVLVDATVGTEDSNDYPYASKKESNEIVADDDGKSGQNDNDGLILKI